MPRQPLARIHNIAWLAGTLAASAWAAPPQPTAAEIRTMKIEFLKDCCFNAGGAHEQAIADLDTDQLLQYPAQRRAVEAQVPRLNHMFEGRYLTHVVVLDDWKLRILYFVKDLNEQDIARVKADPSLPKVQLANSAYASGDVAELTQRYAKEMQQRDFSPQGTAALLSTWGVRYPSLQSVEAFPKAVKFRHDLRPTYELWPALVRLFGSQMVAPARDDETTVLGNPQRRVYVYQPTQDQMQRLQRDPEVRDVKIIPYAVNQAEIERLQKQLQAVMWPSPEGAADSVFTSLGFDYEQRAFNVGVMPGRLDAARQRLRNQPGIPATCCVLEERPPARTLTDIQTTPQPASKPRQQLSNLK